MKIALKLIIYFCLGVSYSYVSSQSLLYDRTPNSVNLQWLRPTIPGGNLDLAFGTSRNSITGRFSVGNNDNSIIIEVPFAYLGIKSFDDSEIALGNIYLGTELVFNNKKVFAELGVALPTVSENPASAVGFVSDFDRPQTFAIDATTIKIRLNYAQLDEEGFIYRFRVGPDYFIISDEFRDGSELFLNYAAQLGFRATNIYGLAGVSAFTIISESELSGAARSQYAFNVMLAISKSRVKPGIVFKVPLDNDFEGLVDNVLGLFVNLQI
ncbi:MAG: hypothetical protein AAGF85_14595 [Bacteroidota bacterium]